MYNNMYQILTNGVRGIADSGLTIGFSLLYSCSPVSHQIGFHLNLQCALANNQVRPGGTVQIALPIFRNMYFAECASISFQVAPATLVSRNNLP